MPNSWHWEPGFRPKASQGKLWLQQSDGKSGQKSQSVPCCFWLQTRLWLWLWIKAVTPSWEPLQYHSHLILSSLPSCCGLHLAVPASVTGVKVCRPGEHHPAHPDPQSPVLHFLQINQILFKCVLSLNKLCVQVFSLFGGWTRSCCSIHKLAAR